MTKKLFLIFVLGLLLLSQIVAQEQKVSVKTDDAAAFKVQNAQLNNVITKNNGKLEENFLLSFLIPNSLESVLPQTRVMLTAYNEKGGIFGQHIWTSASSGMINKLSADNLQIIYGVNPKLQGASSYSLSMGSADRLNLGDIDCPACAALANDTCGRTKVGSVSCGADGSCSFTCR
jgi:hypothetical protein